MIQNNQAIRLDLNNPVFQSHLFGLEKEDQLAVIRTLRKLAKMTWEQVYRDKGIKWEAIFSRTGPHGGRIYSLRLSKGFRATAFRDGEWMRLLSLHPDHDSAYD
jgi:hypothetical protein